MQSQSERVLVLGAGFFGTCLAQHLAKQGHHVSIWSRSQAVVDGINQEHRNPKYLQEVDLQPSLTATSSFGSGRDYTAVILAIPTQALRAVLEQVKGFVLPSHLVVCAAKGIEIEGEKLPSAIISDVLGKEIAEQVVSLSGPSFAVEIAEEQPTGVTLASPSLERARWAQVLFHSPIFRAYTSTDPVGVEVAGAIKNVIAIAAGACVGLGFKQNSRATLLTRGLAEMTRMGLALGADPRTFIGLSGVGDLMLTCSSQKSRNFRVGYALGQGHTLKTTLASMDSVAEGVSTACAADRLAKRLQVRAPITAVVNQVLYQDMPIVDAVNQLLTRAAGAEQD